MSGYPKVNKGYDPEDPKGPQGSRLPKGQQVSKVPKCDLCIELTRRGVDGGVRVPFSHIRRGGTRGNGVIVFTLDGTTITLSESVVREILEQL